jgi:hypothetical protein
MANTVLASLQSNDGTQCVDFFVRDDGSFGFEQFRGEYDGATRWQSLGKYSQMSFDSGPEALHVAKHKVAWLDPSTVWRW